MARTARLLGPRIPPPHASVGVLRGGLGALLCADTERSRFRRLLVVLQRLEVKYETVGVTRRHP